MEVSLNNKFCFSPRLIRSPEADFYYREIENSLEVYSEDYLKEIADEGFSGIWLHLKLQDSIRSSPFPEFGKKSEQHLEILNRLAEKAGRFGIKIYFYLCEPRGLKAEDPFWKKHPGVKGQPVNFNVGSSDFDGKYFALCTSTQEVKEYLEESSCRLFKQIPGLGGLFCITASEFHTHCYSHYPKAMKKFTDPYMEEWKKDEFICGRCADRDPSEIIAEIVSLINKGVKSASPDADVIAWTWSWTIIEPDPQKKLISLLPKDVILMSDWERGGSKYVCGKRYPVDEYSFSYPGPSPRFKKQLNIAKAKGMRIMAKIQISNTHELASVPYLPLPGLLADKMKSMKESGVDGYLGCWAFGGNISPMTRLAGRMSRFPQVPVSKAIAEIAGNEFGEKSAAAVTAAWAHFAKAWHPYPFSIPFLYFGPINYATAYPISLDVSKGSLIYSCMALKRNAKNRLVTSDSLEEWIRPFDAGTVACALRQILPEWKKGIGILRKSLAADPDNRRLEEELNLAEHIELSVRSTINIVRFYPLIRKFREKADGAGRKRAAGELKKIFEDELEITVRDRVIIGSDSRLGYHAEAHCRLFTEEDLDYKISFLKSQLRRL